MKITMYELLGLVKDGKAPKKIKYDNMLWEYNDIYYMTEDNITYLDGYCDLSRVLNDEVEIIAEKLTQEEIKEYANKFLEAWIPVKKQFGKLFDEIARIGNEDELEEEKKIPEKLKLIENGDFIKIPDNSDLMNKINEVIDYLDYLKSKGE